MVHHIAVLVPRALLPDAPPLGRVGLGNVKGKILLVGMQIEPLAGQCQAAGYTLPTV